MLRLLALALALSTADPAPADAQEASNSATRRWALAEELLKVALRVGDAAEARKHLATLEQQLAALQGQPTHEARVKALEGYRRQVEELSTSSL